MGDGRIFLKNLRDTPFNKDLSNEPNWGLIHLAGQYLQPKLRCIVHTWYILCRTQQSAEGIYVLAPPSDKRILLQ